MNELQMRLWHRMIQLVQDYEVGRISFDTLVKDLEGALDAGDFEDDDLRKRWYSAWQRLEIMRATESDPDPQRIRSDLDSFRAVLESGTSQ